MRTHSVPLAQVLIWLFYKYVSPSSLKNALSGVLRHKCATIRNALEELRIRVLETICKVSPEQQQQEEEEEQQQQQLSNF